MRNKKRQLIPANVVYWLNEHFIVINQTEKTAMIYDKKTAAPLYLIQWPIADRLTTAIR